MITQLILAINTALLLIILFRSLPNLDKALGENGKETSKMALDLTQLTADVQADTDAVNAAVKLLSTLSAEIAANVNDPAALTALASTLEAITAALAAAVAANTPAAPAA